MNISFAMARRWALVVGLSAGVAGGALAQGGSSEDGFAPAPGYQEPDVRIQPPVREEVRPFGETPDANVQFGEDPVNVFAGQTRQTDPGIVGGLLGNVKDAIVGER